MKIHSIAQDAFAALNDPILTVKTAADLPEVLRHLVDKIAHIMKADACSLYLHDPSSGTLTLKATLGLNQESVDRLTITREDGLSGLAVKLMKPVSVADVAKSDTFKRVPELDEEHLRSFLAVPLVYNNQPVGLLVIQNRKPTQYRKKDIQLLMSLAIPTVNVIERAKFLGAVGSAVASCEPGAEIPSSSLNDHRIQGLPAASGITMGRLKKVIHRKAMRRRMPDEGGIAFETKRLKEAFAAVTQEIQNTKVHAEKKFGPEEVSIFEAYLLFLESRSFQNQILAEIDAGRSAASALDRVTKKYMDRIAQGGDEYLKERAYDIQDVSRKIKDHLLYGDADRSEAFAVTEDTVFLSDNWSISDFVGFDPHRVKAVISSQGGANSHIAILAESLGLPAVFGLGTACAHLLKEGDDLIVDGNAGLLIVNPTPDTVAFYRREIHEADRIQKSFLKGKDRHLKLVRHGIEENFPIGANIEMPDQATSALKAGADEIGLFRTEFPFLAGRALPTEEEQYLSYRRVLHAMKNRPVTFRTLDIGCDKNLAYLDMPKEVNPALGWRSIRFSLERKDLFRIQLRALFRASAHGKTRLLFPMVSSLEEVCEVEDVLESVKKELADEGRKTSSHVAVGYMIEVPAAVEIAGAIAKRADFLSIGTNDLIQYTLAVDRANAKVAHLYDPFHPAVLKLIHVALKAAHKEGKPVSVCGDMASKPLLVPVFWAMGVSSLSMNPHFIPKIKELLARLEFAEIHHLTQKILHLNRAREIKDALGEYFKKKGWAEF